MERKRLQVAYGLQIPDGRIRHDRRNAYVDL